MSRLRPRRQAEAYLRRAVLAGQEAQVDWAHFGKLTVGRAVRDLWAFVMVLAYSRMRYVRFSLRAAMPSFLRGHVEAFRFFDAVPRVVLYDNLKSAVLEREGDAVRFHPTLLELAGHYRFEPRACAPYRPNEKGRVERAIRDVRDNFFAARPFAGIDDLNAQAAAWCLEIAKERHVPDQKDKTVHEAFLEDKAAMIAHAPDAFPAEERVDARQALEAWVIAHAETSTKRERDSEETGRRNVIDLAELLAQALKNVRTSRKEKAPSADQKVSVRPARRVSGKNRS